MRKHDLEQLTFTQQLDHKLTLGAAGDEDEAIEGVALVEQLGKATLNRPKPPPLDLDEILRTLPKRRYTRRSTQPNPMETNDSNLDL